MGDTVVPRLIQRSPLTTNHRTGRPLLHSRIHETCQGLCSTHRLHHWRGCSVRDERIHRRQLPALRRHWHDSEHRCSVDAVNRLILQELQVKPQKKINPHILKHSIHTWGALNFSSISITSIQSAYTRLGCFFETGVYYCVNDCCKKTSITQ